MSKRAISRSARSWLEGEVDLWRAEGVVSDDQGRRILDLYPTPAESAQRVLSVASYTLLGLAGFMIALAVLLVVCHNWDAISPTTKLVMVFGAVLGAHAIGFRLRFARGKRVASDVAFFMGCLLYGVGIWQVAQIFQIQAHYPNAFWYWALGTLPFALLLDTWLLHLLYAGLLAHWVGSEILGFPGVWTFFFGTGFGVPYAALSLPLLVLPGLVWAYRQQSNKGLTLYLAVLTWWLALQPVAWDWETSAAYFLGGVGATLLLVGQAHREGSPLALPYRLFGSLICAGALLVMSFYDFNSEMFSVRHTPHGILLGVVILAMGLAGLVIGVFMRRGTWLQGPVSDETILDAVWRQWLPVGMIVLMTAFAWSDALLGATPLKQSAPILITILANVGVLVLALWLISLGLHEDRGRPFTAGIVYFLIWTFCRYVDLFGEFGGMLGASLLFFLCGISLFGVAVYWRKRKEICNV